MEYGESFEEAASRETYEETGIHIDPREIRYITTLNVMDLDIGYHNVGISLVTLVKKEEILA